MTSSPAASHRCGAIIHSALQPLVKRWWLPDDDVEYGLKSERASCTSDSLDRPDRHATWGSQIGVEVFVASLWSLRLLDSTPLLVRSGLPSLLVDTVYHTSHRLSFGTPFVPMIRTQALLIQLSVLRRSCCSAFSQWSTIAWWPGIPSQFRMCDQM